MVQKALDLPLSLRTFASEPSQCQGESTVACESQLNVHQREIALVAGRGNTVPLKATKATRSIPIGSGVVLNAFRNGENPHHDGGTP